MNIFGRGDGIRLTRKQRVLIASALNLAANQWLQAARDTKEGQDFQHTLELAGEAKALAILLEPEAEGEGEG